MRDFSLHIQAVIAVSASLCAAFAAVPTVRGQQRVDTEIAVRGPGESNDKELRVARLDDMRRRAEGTVIVRLDGTKRFPAKLVIEPALRYSDQFHGAVDATTWIYGGQGRPAAVAKIEIRRWHVDYCYCVASLCDQTIEVRWPDRPAWSSTSPGVEMREIPAAPQPASTEAGRTRQMKETIRRFTAVRIDAGDVREENRVLLQPIHRYRDPNAGIQDGAVFAFIANGTNPDFLVLVELRGPDLARATWNYGPLRMTTGELHLRLDGKEVWSVPWQCVPGRNEYPTYVHFHLK